MSKNTADGSSSRLSSLFTMSMLIKVLSILLPVWGIIFNLQLFYYADVMVLGGQYYASFVGITLLIIFLSLPAKKGGRIRQWFDYILAFASVVFCGYFVINYRTIVYAAALRMLPTEMVLGIVAVLVVLEAVRRTTGWVMIIISIFFIIHALYAHLFPSLLHGPEISFERLISSAYLSSEGIFGFIMGIASTYIIAFATFGAFLVAFGGGQKLTNLALSMVGRVKGGAAKVSIFSSALLGTLTGDPISNVGISGSFTLPMMKRMNFKPEFAAAVETVGSVGGVILPPMMGAIIFIMVEVTGIPYFTIMKAAIVPAMLYFVAVFLQIDFFSKRTGLAGLPASEIPKKTKAIKESFFIFIAFFILIYLLGVERLFPVRAAYYSLGAMIVLFMVDPSTEFSFKKILSALEIATRFTIGVVPLVGAAGIVLASLTLTGTGVRMAYRLVEVAGGSLFLLVILTAIICYVLGLGISAMLAYIILSAFVAPALVEFGVPVIAAHFFIIYAGLFGFFTPPYAVVALTASALAGSNFYSTCWQSMRLAVVAFLIPITIVLDPVLLFHEVTLSRFLFRAFISLCAIYLLAGGIEGYMLKKNLNNLERTILIAGSVSLFIPNPFLLVAGTLISAAGLAVIIINTGIKTRREKVAG